MRSKSLLMVCIAGVLTACQANDESLTEFIRDVENQARRDVTKLQPVEEYVVVNYEPEILRAPFELPKRQRLRLNLLQEKTAGNLLQESELANWKGFLLRNCA